MVKYKPKLYGSGRLGTLAPAPTMHDTTILPNGILKRGRTNYRGLKRYYLSGHTGNTLAIVSDKRLPVDSDRNGTIDYYEADLTAATCYYSYGAVAQSFNADSIRYAFNGQRRSFEISNTAQTALYWEYDGDVGRRWNLSKPTLGVSPYNCFGGNPVWRSDVLGDTSIFKDADNNVLKRLDDGANAIFKQKGSGVGLHYSLDGFDAGQNMKNRVNVTSAIQEQQILNNENEALMENAEGHGETHCNQAAINLTQTVSSIYKDNSIVFKGNANKIHLDLEGGVMYSTFMKVSREDAEINAKNGGLSFVTYFDVAPKNPHGHIASFSVGVNLSNGPVANIGPSAYSGFVPLNNAINKKKDKSYFIFVPIENLEPVSVSSNKK